MDDVGVGGGGGQYEGGGGGHGQEYPLAAEEGYEDYTGYEEEAGYYDDQQMAGAQGAGDKVSRSD